MRLNDIGNIAQKHWDEIPRHYPFVVLDAFVVMPNHIHGVLIIERVPVGANNHSPDPESSRPVLLPVSACVPERKTGNGFGNGGGYGNGGGFGFRAKNISPLRKPFGTSGTVGAVVRGYKIGVTKWCRTYARANVVWQRNYHERIIRDEHEWDRIREYIEKNPESWEQDELNAFGNGNDPVS